MEDDLLAERRVGDEEVGKEEVGVQLRNRSRMDGSDTRAEPRQREDEALADLEAGWAEGKRASQQWCTARTGREQKRTIVENDVHPSALELAD